MINVKFFIHFLIKIFDRLDLKYVFDYFVSSVDFDNEEKKLKYIEIKNYEYDELIRLLIEIDHFNIYLYTDFDYGKIEEYKNRLGNYLNFLGETSIDKILTYKILNNKTEIKGIFSIVSYLIKDKLSKRLDEKNLEIAKILFSDIVNNYESDSI